MLYKQILKPLWTYGIQLWGRTKQSNINIIQRFQNEVLENIVDAPWYTRNADLHWDCQMVMVTNQIRKYAKKHEERLYDHVNVEAVMNANRNCKLTNCIIQYVLMLHLYDTLRRN